MGVLLFLLALVLLVAGAAGGYLGLDLLPTGPGLLYVFAGAVAAVGAVVVFALGVVVARLDRLTGAVRESAAAAGALAAAPERRAGAAYGLAPLEAESVAEATPEAGGAKRKTAPEGEPAETAAGTQEVEDHETADDDAEPVNENRAGHLPTLGEIEQAIETPEPPPTLIGRYSSGGANYMIFSDGSIEAETDEGAYKFASMGDFKQFLMERNAGKA